MKKRYLLIPLGIVIFYSTYFSWQKSWVLGAFELFLWIATAGPIIYWERKNL